MNVLDRIFSYHDRLSHGTGLTCPRDRNQLGFAGPGKRFSDIGVPDGLLDLPLLRILKGLIHRDRGALYRGSRGRGLHGALKLLTDFLDQFSPGLSVSFGALFFLSRFRKPVPLNDLLGLVILDRGHEIFHKYVQLLPTHILGGHHLFGAHHHRQPFLGKAVPISSLFPGFGLKRLVFRQMLRKTLDRGEKSGHCVAQTLLHEPERKLLRENDPKSGFERLGIFGRKFTESEDELNPEGRVKRARKAGKVPFRAVLDLVFHEYRV